MCQSERECSSQISAPLSWGERKNDVGGSGMGEQYRCDLCWKKSFAQFSESSICPVGWFYQSLTAMVKCDLNDWVSYKAGKMSG